MADSMTGSEIVRLGNEISTRIRNGETIYNYTIGDFNSQIFPIPALLEELIVAAYKEHYTNYPAAEGILELREAVAQFINERQGLAYGVNEIQISCGGRPLIYTIFRTVVDAGDKVIYAVPSWNNNHYTHLNEAQHVKIEAAPENNFMPAAQDIAPHLEGAALLCLCTPQNPTGTTLGKEELEQICHLVIAENNRRAEGEKKLYVMFDQIYGELTYGDTKHYNPVSLVPAMRDYTIFVDGISKAFAATGVRVGWSVGPAPVIAKMKAFISHIGAWAPMAEQHATARFLSNTKAVDEYLLPFKQAIEARLRSIYNGFMKLKEKGFSVDAITPQAAIYLTIQLNLTGKKTADGKLLASQSDVTDYILSEAKLAVVPFYAFGAGTNSPWYRLSVGTCTEEEIGDMLGKLQQALEQLI
jgi:aspartate aminotransferase